MNSPENSKNFLEHLEDLRKLIFRVLFAVVLLLPVAFFFTDELISLLVGYSCPPDFTLKYFSPMEPLFVKIKVSLLAAFIVALPYIAYECWKFTVPALYPHERFQIKRLALLSWLLFIAGAVFCFSVIIPAMMRFSLSMQTSELHPAIGLSNYISLSGMLLLGFGIMFQLPVVILFMVMSGLVKLETIKKLRAIVLISILTLSALLTPPDIFSQLAMAVPTYLLFELSLLVAGIALRSRKEPAPEHVDPPENDSPSEPDKFFPPPEKPEPEDYLEHYQRHAKAGKKRKLHYISKR